MFEKKYKIKDLFVTYPGIISINDERDTIYFNEDDDLEEIIVVKINEHYVKNVISGLVYGIFNSFSYKHVSFIGQYMVNQLLPLELLLDDKTKKYITKEEIISFLSPRIKEEPTSKYRDIILQKIYETNQKIKTSKIDETQKEKFQEELIKLANYYVNEIQKINISSQGNNNLELNKKSIISLKQECMARLVDIELILPPENINMLLDEITKLEEDIKKKM